MLRLKIVRLEFPRARPVAISFHTWNVRQSFLVFLEYENLQGIGEANPFKPITGDSAEELIEEARQIAHIPLDPAQDDLEALHVFLERTTCKSLQAAIDCAYHDLAGKIARKPVYRIYAERPRYVDNSVTVFLQNSAAETAREASRIYREFPHLKILKIKLKGEGDLDRARAVKEVSPSGMKFTLDANQGFADPQVAIEVLTQIGEILGDVILVEEPCPKGQLDKLKLVKDRLPNMMVFADESAATLSAVREVAAADAAHGVNIKLQKAGGIWPAKQIARFCEASGLKIMVGAMIEGPVAIAAGVHFAVSTTGVIFTDLDTDLDLPLFTRGHSEFVAGSRHVVDSPGMGIVLEELQGQQQITFTPVLG